MNHHQHKSRARSKKSSARYGGPAGLAYNDHLRDFVREGRVMEAAADARQAIDGPEGDELREAEQAGKSRVEMRVSDRARAIVDRVGRAVKAALHELKND